MPEKTFKTAHNQLKKRGQYDPEMERYTDEYLSLIHIFSWVCVQVPAKAVLLNSMDIASVAIINLVFLIANPP